MALLKNIYVLIGKSGSGKSAIAGYLNSAFGWVCAESYTDRPKRTETEKGHRFVTPEQFDSIQERILETRFDGYRYTMTKEILNDSDFIILDTSGVISLKADYCNRGIMVIGIEADEEQLSERMKKCGDSDEKIARRLEHDKTDFAGYNSLCDCIIKNNDTLENACKCVQDIVLSVESET